MGKKGEIAKVLVLLVFPLFAGFYARNREEIGEKVLVLLFSLHLQVLCEK